MPSRIFFGSSSGSPPAGTLDATLPAFTADLAGEQQQQGAIAATLPAFSADFVSVQAFEGPLAATLPKFSAQLQGTRTHRGGGGGKKVHVTGTMGARVPAFSAALAGWEEVFGDVDATLPAFGANGTAIFTGYSSGPLIATLPAFSAAFTGQQAQVGNITATLPKFSAALEGWATIVGAITASLPAFSASLTGSAAVSSVTIRIITRQYGWFIHSPFWPGERLWELNTWHNGNRSWARFEVGNADVDVASSEVASCEWIREGYLLVIVQPQTPIWAGPMLTFERNSDSGITRIDALGIASLLDGQDAQQEVRYTKAVASGGVARALLSSVNRLANSGIYSGRIENGPTIKDLQIGAQSAWQSLEELHKRTNYEYWVEVEADAAHLRPRLNWQARQGLDLSARLHLWEGEHFGKLVSHRDLSQAKAAQTAIGDFGALIPDRTSVTVLASGKRANNGAAVRHVLHQLPPGLRNTRTFVVPMTGHPDELEREARRELVRPLNSSQTYALSVPANTLGADWLDLQVGNYLTLHPQDEAEVVVRVVGYSPDEESGALDLATEAVLV